MNEVARIKPGRPPGAKNKLANSFVEDIAAEWSRSGPQILKVMAQAEPAKFADLVARVVPKDIAITLSPQAGPGLDAADYAVLSAIKAALPFDPNTRPASEVFDYVARAVRAYGAKTIDNRD
jgi:hypothetical protein